VADGVKFFYEKQRCSIADKTASDPFPKMVQTQD
jgi:hypothetical protein